ncbi:MAG: hypothetical protein AAF253_03060 [Pseudomonadota bacterium]
MRGPTFFVRRVTVALVLAISVQCVTVLMWIGAAAERLDALERTSDSVGDDHIRLAKLETQLELIHRQLDRIEARLEPAP